MTLYLASARTASVAARYRGGYGVPEVVGMRVDLEGYYTGYPPDQSQGPIFSIFQALDPTHGQMKGFSDYFMRFPR